MVNHIESLGYSFKESNSAAYLASVDRLLSSKRSASAKSKLTDDYLNLLELTYDGKSGSKQFSRQRDWLNKTYEKICTSDSEKENFTRIMGDIADYLTNVVDYNPMSAYLAGMQSMAEPDRGVASVCLLYLQKASHKMANTVLSRFYSQVLRGTSGGDAEFVSTCKAVAAFFTIWRSALPNTGLDDVYRKLLRDHISWKKGDSELNSQFLKDYFRDILSSKGIGTKADWLAKAKDYLKYDESLTICRFVLFVVAEDTIVDPTAPGLMKLGNRGATPPYLTAQRWVSEELKSIEHIAPQKPELRQPWDLSLYQNDDYQRIGNLALLPIPINSSLSNKGWVEKFIYYQHLAEKDPTKLAQLKLEAQTHGVTLNSQALELLTSTPVKQHMESIIQIGIMGVWDKNLVDRRSERICDILWDRISPWIT